MVLAVIIAIFFARIGASPGPAPIEQDAGRAPDGAAQDSPADRRWRWTWQNLFPIFFVLVAGFFVWEALGFRPKAASFPLLLGSAVIILAVDPSSGGNAVVGPIGQAHPGPVPAAFLLPLRA